MALTIGVALIVLAVAAFVYSLPRGGKLAFFVGTEWEGYAVTSMIGALGVGMMLSIAGLVELSK